MEQFRDGSKSAVSTIDDVFVWDRQFETGIAAVDEQHRKLVELINMLGRILATETDAESLEHELFAVFDELAAYVGYHFDSEEKLMARYHAVDEHESVHKRAHAEFIRQLAEARTAAREQPVEVAGRILTFLSKWLMTHIVGTDMRMAKKILAIQSGMSEQNATRQANDYMSNATDALLQAMNRLYENLAGRTRSLLDAKRSLDREIAVRRQVEAELRKLSRAVEHSPVSIIITDPRARFEYVNPKFSELTGYTLEEIIGETPRILGSGNTAAAVYADLWATIGAGREWHGELQNRKKNGEVYWDYASISPVFDPQGKITHYVSIQEDITARKRAEAELSQQKLISDEIINSLPGIFYMLNAAGSFVRVNPQFVQVTGYSDAEVRRMNALDFFEGDDRGLIAERMQEVFTQGDSQAEAEFMIRSGRKIPYFFTGHRTIIDGQPYLVGLGTDITRRRELEQELVRQARTDALTGLANRRHFLAQAEQEFERAKRYHKPLSVLMLDLDEFKVINDEYGHQAGDDVLRKVGEVCRDALRAIDSVGRLGGEEFAIMLPETEVAEAQEVGERLCREIAAAQIPLDPAGTLNITASIGVATLAARQVSIDQLLNLADMALYEAKRAGRNRVIISRQ